ncbi:hypothetical protein LIA77_09876 [Sarocladium implicatum]|nr:hypothetical protein LIA77_09876 [Sarocladium implicatum]
MRCLKHEICNRRTWGSRRGVAPTKRESPWPQSLAGSRKGISSVEDEVGDDGGRVDHGGLGEGSFKKQATAGRWEKSRGVQIGAKRPGGSFKGELPPSGDHQRSPLSGDAAGGPQGDTVAAATPSLTAGGRAWKQRVNPTEWHRMWQTWPQVPAADCALEGAVHCVIPANVHPDEPKETVGASRGHRAESRPYQCEGEGLR